MTRPPIGEGAHRAYLDHNATSPLRPEARSVMRRLLDAADDHGNPSSVHREGRAARAVVARAREQVARATGARPGDLVFTGSATEANTQALRGVFADAASAGKAPGLVVTAVEHPSVSDPARALAASGAAELVVVGVGPEGQLDDRDWRSALAGAPRLVSVMAANNETGALFDVPAVCAAAHEAGALAHVDAAQALGRVPVDVCAWGADLVSISSHKLGGPAGVGALWVRPGVELSALMLGGHQERNRRAGTEAVWALAGFGAAAEAATRSLSAEAARLAALRDALWDGLVARIEGVHRVAPRARALPNTLHVWFDGADGETLLIALDLEGVAASSGSACTAGSLDPSPVLLAMGVPAAAARSALRLSLGWSTSEREVRHALDVLPGVVARARGEGGA